MKNWSVLEKFCVLVSVAIIATIACHMKSRPSPPPQVVEKKEIQKKEVIHRKSSSSRSSFSRGSSYVPRVVATPAPTPNLDAISNEKMRRKGVDPEHFYPIVSIEVDHSAPKGRPEGEVK